MNKLFEKVITTYQRHLPKIFATGFVGGYSYGTYDVVRTSYYNNPAENSYFIACVTPAVYGSFGALAASTAPAWIGPVCIYKLDSLYKSKSA